MLLTNKQKQDFITKIKTSNSFKKASTSSALLVYLHESTVKGVDLTENVIDLEFFGSKESLEKNNTRVRVSVYNLRKKLTDYYSTEGANDKWQAAIEKGQYQLVFKPKHTHNWLKQHNWKTLLPYYAIAICLALLYITNKAPSTPKIWRHLLSKHTTTELYIGDLFGMTGTTTTGRRGFIRDAKINNLSAYYAFLDKKPEYKDILSPATFKITTGMAIFSTQQFQKFFQEHQQEFSISFTSRTSTNRIKQENAIYIGHLSGRNPFTFFFNQANPYCKIERHTLVFNSNDTAKERIYDLKQSNEKQEYAVVSKYQATENTEHFVFFSMNDIGVTATVEYFTNTDSIKAFEKKYLDEKEHFTAVFKVQGQERTNTNLSLDTVVVF